MCPGRFIDPVEMETNESDGDVLSALECQVALGSDSGAIYMMSNFQVVYNCWLSGVYIVKIPIHIEACIHVIKDFYLYTRFLSKLQVYPTEFANINYPIRKMTTLKAADSQNTDTILCAGHFNALSVLRDGVASVFQF